MPTVKCNDIDARWDDIPAAPYRLANAAHIWRIHISECVHVWGKCTGVLNSDEKVRAASYRSELHRDRFILSRGILRFLLALYTGELPQAILLMTGDNGKPFMSSAGRQVCYSMTHSGDLILISLSDAPAGIDVEYIDADFDFAGVLSICFSAGESVFIQNTNMPTASFYKLWTRKESLLKATGKGIVNDLDRVPSLDGVHRTAPWLLGSEKDWEVSSFEAAKGYAGSIARTTKAGPVRFCSSKILSDLFTGIFNWM